MKRIISITILSFSFILFAFSWNIDESIANKRISERVDELISKMTLEEKVGQMTQITLQVVAKKQGTVDQKFELDYDKLKDAIINYHVGSILNVYDVAHTTAEWHELIGEIQEIATNKTRLGIPVIYGIDAIHGATYTKEATLFPQAINMAATWNKALLKKEGEITAKQVRASGIPWNFYPVMDIGRQPLWPRLWETYGEDVLLATSLGVSYIEGAQGSNYGASDKTATCLKHYVGYSFPLNGRDRTPAWISERTLREYFLPTFEAGIKAGSPTIMVNSAEVNGIPVHSDHHLLTEILREELNFEGFVVSDWEDIKRLYTRDRVASSPEEAVKMAVMAGVDMSMVPYDFSFYNILIDLVESGQVPVLRIDEAVKRILTVKMKLGLFEQPMPINNYKKVINNEEYERVNFESAVESIILTKNESDLLPLSKNSKVLITGPTANLLSSLNGGWTYTWQGNEEKLYPDDENTIVEAIQNNIGNENLKFVETPDFENIPVSDELLSKIDFADVIIVCLGEPAYCESPGNINDLTLPSDQLNLVKELSKSKKPIVLLMLQGRPRLINSIVDKAQSVLIGFLPGLKGGDAIASILFGDSNPSGKLPITYPKYPNGFVSYDYKPLEVSDGNSYDPQWAFGYGLSYTDFEYSDLKIDKSELLPEDTLTVSVNVSNSGERPGKEVVQLYLCDMYGSVSRPVKQLKAFDKIELQPGEEIKVSFTLSSDDFSFIGRNNKRIVEAGDFEIYVDTLKSKFAIIEQ